MMLKYIAKRIGAGFVLLFGVSTATFVLLTLGAGNIARNQLGMSATDEQVQRLTEQLGLNRPVLERYWSWLRHAATGDFGKSWFSPSTVVDSIKDRLTITLTIVIGAMLIAVLAAVVLGVVGAVRGGGVDRFVQGVALAGFAIPGFLVAFVVITLFAVKLGWFKAGGFVPFGESWTGWLKSIALPIVSLAAGALASATLQVRGTVRDALENDYVRTLRSRGVPSRRVLFEHVLRNSAGPALQVIGVQFIGMLGAAIIIERLFVLPGLGEIAVTSTQQGDIPLVMGLVVVVAVLVVIVNLAIDLITAWLNPKVRLS
jgi:peptide/nickel transport system permease protein